MQDQQKIILLTNQLEELRKLNKDQKELIFQYEEQNGAAEKKINALNQIHQDKVRNLMNSITLLKKENAQLKNMNKEHKRSQLIEQLNQEIADQDLVIQTLRSIVNNDQRCDNQIIEALNKGPPKIKALTREELKIENKKLENQLRSLKEQMTKKQQELMQSDQSENASTFSLDAQFDIHTKKIAQLTEDNSNFKAEIAALQDKNFKLEETLDEKSRQITVLNEQKGQLVILTKKYEQLQKLMEDYKRRENQQEFHDITKEVDIEEQKMLNKVQETKLESVEKQLRAEIDIIKLEKQGVQRDLENKSTELGKVIKKNQQLEKRLMEQEKELNAKSKELRERIEEFARKEADYQTQISQLKQQITQKELEISQLLLDQGQMKANIAKLEQDIEQLQAKLQRAGAYKQVDDISYDVKINKEIQNKLKQQTISDDPKVLKQALKQQQQYYEQVIQVLQQRVLQQKQDNLSDVSSNISKLIKQDDNNQEIDMLSSDISQFEKKQQDYDVDSNIEDQNIPSDIHSSVTSILNAPKPTKKQMDSNYSRFESMKSSDIDKISSNLSDQQNASLSKVSSNLSKISFTSSMQRAVKRY
ncbi:unnamed protein product [Paramecium primaurelia]|uniref:Uncharacterized protein n=1 Tax=Paramecium primaurelia TaxID=5886 RepID=A0A8S1MA84_PARPR|nr:unnamed protein product [Paramecium primaurelia]